MATNMRLVPKLTLMAENDKVSELTINGFTLAWT